MEPINTKIAHLLTNGYELQFENVFNKAFENYKKIALYAGLALLIFGFIFMVLAAFGLISFVGVEHLNENTIKQLESKMLKQEYLGYQFIFVLAINSLFSPISAGFLRMANAAQKDVEFKMRHFFSFYQWSYFKELFVATFIITCISSGIDTALTHFKIPVVGGIISFGIGILTVLSTPLIIFGKQKAIKALQASIQLTSSKILTLFLLLFVAFLGSLVGLIGFCIGVLFTIPFSMSMQYSIYDSIIGFENNDVSVIDFEEN
jgi:hypothetical protein